MHTETFGLEFNLLVPFRAVEVDGFRQSCCILAHAPAMMPVEVPLFRSMDQYDDALQSRSIKPDNSAQERTMFALDISATRPPTKQTCSNRSFLTHDFPAPNRVGAAS